MYYSNSDSVTITGELEVAGTFIVGYQDNLVEIYEEEFGFEDDIIESYHESYTGITKLEDDFFNEKENY